MVGLNGHLAMIGTSLGFDGSVSPSRTVIQLPVTQHRLHCHFNSEDPVAIDYHVLSSLSATLDDVVNRVGELARTADEDDDAAIDLQEIERQLTTASRRLAKVVRRQI